MKKHLYWIIPLVIIALYILISAIKGIWNPLNWFSSAAPDDCLAENKKKIDGEECIICTAPNTRAAEIKGIIRNGVCIEKTEPIDVSYDLVVTKTGGAPVYNFTNGNFVVTTKIIPEGTKIKSIALVTSPQTMYQVSATEYLSGNDVGANTQSPQ